MIADILKYKCWVSAIANILFVVLRHLQEKTADFGGFFLFLANLRKIFVELLVGEEDEKNGKKKIFFRLDRYVNLATMVTVLYRLEGEPDIISSNKYDIPEDWYTPAAI